MKTPAFRVTLDARHPETHRVRVTIEARGATFPNLLQFPVWTPGSYLVREFSRHITRFTGGEKVSKNSWRPQAGGRKVTYEAYCFERTVRTSYLDDRVASWNGATLLPLLEGAMEIHVLLPRHWQTLGTALATQKRGPGHWILRARDDDEWIDSPIVAAAPGNGGQARFRSRGKAHRITWIGNTPAVAIEKLTRDVKLISDTVQKMFGGAPFRAYDYLFDFPPRAYGGLEHRSSQLSHFDGFDLGDAKKYEAFLALVAHEYFHAWNVKSLRPQALGPFDYLRENYTPDLWFAEGLTSYFDDKLVFEAGLISEASYNAVRLKDVNTLKDGTPGITRRSLAEASFDAWIRYYRPDEDSLNTDVSYYVKGAQLGWCWDAYLQKKTRGRWTLARLMRAFWREFGIAADEPLREAKPGFSHEEIFEFAHATTGVDHAVVREWVHSRKPLPWRMAAAHFKLKFKEKPAPAALALAGMNLLDRDGKAMVGSVFSGSSAEAAGLAANDELIAIASTRIVNAEHAQMLLRRNAARPSLDLLFARAGKVATTKVRLRKHSGLGLEFEV